MLPLLLCTHASLASWLSTEGMPPRTQNASQNAQPMVWLRKAQDAQHAWLSDPRGEVVATERAEGPGWIQLRPREHLAPGDYVLHTKHGQSYLHVEPGLDHTAPNGSATFTYSAWQQGSESFHFAISGPTPQDQNAVVLQLQVWSPDEPTPSVDRVDATSMEPWLSQDFDGQIDHSLFRARWIDVAGNKTAWSRPEVVGETVYDKQAETARQLRVVGIGLVPLLLGLVSAALLYRDRKPKHRSPVGLRRPISPGPR